MNNISSPDDMTDFQNLRVAYDPQTGAPYTEELNDALSAVPTSAAATHPNAFSPDTLAKVQCVQQAKIFSWVVVLVLVPSVVAFIIKMANLIFPLTDCTASSIVNPAACLNDNNNQKTFLYMTIFVISIIGLILAIAMSNSKTISRTVSTSIALGCAFGILYAIWSNYDKLGDTVQLIIIGLTIIGIAMIPKYVKPC